MVERAEIFVFALPGTGATARGSWKRTVHYFAVVTDTDGRRGVGEGTPYQGRLIENVLNFALIRRRIEGLEVADARRALESLQTKVANSGCFDYAAYLAVDSALLRLKLSQEGTHFSNAFGGIHRDRASVYGTVFLDSCKNRIQRVKDWSSKGVTHFKVKLTGHCKVDIPFLHLVRSAVGEDAVIRVDANGTFPSMDAALRVLRELDRLSVAEVEQPFPAGNPIPSSKLRDRLRMRVYLDEDAVNRQSIGAIARARAADGIHIHPSRFGSLSLTRGIIKYVRDLGMEWSIGSNAFTGLGTLIHLLLLLSEEERATCVEEVGHLEQFGCDIVREPFVIKHGSLTLPVRPERAISVDPAKFREYAMPEWTPVRRLMDSVRLSGKLAATPILTSMRRNRVTSRESSRAG